MNSPDFRASLLALRAGELSFDRFVLRHSSAFRAMAAHFVERWNPDFLTHDDLTQEALLEGWRAVDSWDPEKTADIVRYVEYQVGRKLRVECERVLGWPRKATAKRAGQTAVRPRGFVDGELGEETAREGDYARTLPALKTTTTPEDVALGAEVVELFTGLQRDAVAGVIDGAPIRTIAQRVYADKKRRRAYGMQSLDHAIRMVRTAVRQAPKTIDRRFSASA